MAQLVNVLTAYVILEALKFGYTVGWDWYNLSRGVYP